MWSHFSTEEISRQLNDSNAKVIFGLASMSGVLQQAVAMTNRPIKIVYARETENESLPADGIDLEALTSTKGEIICRRNCQLVVIASSWFLAGINLSGLKTYERESEDVAMLPYSRYDWTF